MNSDFTRSLEKLLGGGDRRETPRREPAQAKPPAETADSRHRKWFAQYANEHVLPLLTHTVEALKRRGFVASCQLLKDGEDVTGELVVIPPGLPPRAKPPRFAVSAAPGSRGVAIDYTGTFPHPGTEAGFGSEVVYDTVSTSELEEQLLDFVRMAAGA